MKAEIKQKFEEIKKAVEGFVNSELKFATYTTKDGVTLEVTGDLTINAEVTTLDEGGNKIPAPDGDYVINVDNTDVVVSIMGGKVEAIEPFEAETAETVAPVAMAEVENKVKELTESLTSANEVIESLKSEVETLKAKEDLTEKFNALEKSATEQKELINKIFGLVELMANVPAEEPLDNKQSFSTNKSDKDSKLKELALTISKFKK